MVVFGLNQNFSYRGRVYHIQTEDSGLDKAHIITHLFTEGVILETKRADYDDILGLDNIEKIIKELMMQQHRAVLLALKNGAYDPLLPPPPPGSEAERVENERLAAVAAQGLAPSDGPTVRVDVEADVPFESPSAGALVGVQVVPPPIPADAALEGADVDLSDAQDALPPPTPPPVPVAAVAEDALLRPPAPAPAVRAPPARAGGGAAAIGRPPAGTGVPRPPPGAAPPPSAPPRRATGGTAAAGAAAVGAPGAARPAGAPPGGARPGAGAFAGAGAGAAARGPGAPRAPGAAATGAPRSGFAARAGAPAPSVFGGAPGGAKQDTIFGEDLISERSLDEVILEYLAGDLADE